MKELRAAFAIEPADSSETVLVNTHKLSCLLCFPDITKAIDTFRGVWS